MFSESLSVLWLVWGGITALLVIVLIYRSFVVMREDDQLFLGAADASASKLQAEQQQILNRIKRLRPYIAGLSVASGLVLVWIAGVWVYRGIVGFNNTGLQP